MSLAGRIAVVVDDGIATGSTARAACQVARAHGAARVVLAVPVAPVGWTARFSGVADEFVCLATPDPFFAIGRFYVDFSQTSDEEVVTCLQRASKGTVAMSPGSGSAEDDPLFRDEEVALPAGPFVLGGHLTVPCGAISHLYVGGQPRLTGTRSSCSSRTNCSTDLAR